MRRYIFGILLLYSFCCNVDYIAAQVDTEFWFAVPYLSEHTQDASYHLMVFAKGNAANVTISMPASADFSPINVHVTKNGYQDIIIASSYTLAQTQLAVPNNVVSQKALLIESDEPIYCYFQISDVNGEAFTLKGKKALGTEFYVLSQNTLVNGTSLAKYKEAYHSVQILATEDNTQIAIAPTQQVGTACSSIPFTITLQRGETYSFRSCSKEALKHLLGTKITSNKPIAINSTDDSLFVPVVNGKDLAGDQLTPTDYWGTEYIAVGCAQNFETLNIIAKEDNTFIQLSNGFSFTLNAGGIQTVPMNSVTTMYIQSDKPIGIWQLTGLTSEVGGTNLPSLHCTGSHVVKYKKLYGSRNTSIHIITLTSNKYNFFINGISISSNEFHVVSGTSSKYSYASIDVTSIASDIINVECLSGLFHIGVIDFANSNNNETSNSCTYGYFSDYGSAHEYDEYDKFEEGTTYVWSNHYISGSTTNMTFTIEGEYRDTLADINGCDSICVLHLSLCHRLTGDTSAIFCNGSLFSWHDVSYSTAGDYTFMYTSKVAPYCDSIVTLHLTQLEPSDSIEIATICAGDTYTWHGQLFTISTTTTESLPNTVGCDSICTLQLTVLHELVGDTSATICNGSSFTWHDVSYSTAGDYTYTYTSHVAPYCDSTVTLHLIQLEPSDSIEMVTICEGETYTWHGNTYTSTTDITETITNAAGCDSVCTLHLKVNPKQAGDTIATFCKGSSFMWHGVTYSTAGNYPYTYTSKVTGCDSIVTLHLTQLEPSDSIEIATICAGETYTWHGKTFTATTSTTETIPNAVGCDSVCTLHLTIMPPLATSINETITEGATYLWNGQTYSEKGTYTQSFTTAEGCDSIVTLNLTVNPLIYDILANIQCADDPYIEFDVTASDGLFQQLQFVFTPKAIAQHFRDTIVDYSASQILIPNSARAGIYEVAVSPLYNSQVLDTRNFQFTLLYPSSVLDQHWDDFIGVLTHNYNGGYDFFGFQWYKNGQPMAGENHSYTYQPLEMGAAYSAMLEEQDGTKLMTCEIIATPQTEISIYPTLLQPRQIIRLHSSKDVTIWLYDNIGKLIYNETFSQGDHQFAAPQTSGVYIIRIQQIGESGKSDTRKLIVR